MPRQYEIGIGPIHATPPAKRAELDLDGCLRLVGAVLSYGAGPEGVKVRSRLVPHADYFRDPCGRWWASTAGLDPAFLYKMAVKDTPAEGKAFRPLTQCPFCHSTDADMPQGRG